MSNIRVDVDYTIHDGSELKFRSPVDCSAITGLIVYYPGADGNTTSKVFALADAHGNNVGAIDHLFAENVVVKVILDVTTGMAFVQNADTNAYLEAQFASKAPAGYGLGASVVGATGYRQVNHAEADSLNKTGVYWFRDDTNHFYQDGMNSGFAGVLIHFQHNNHNAAKQIFIPYYKYGVSDGDGVDAYVVVERTRRQTDGTWTPIEWRNPPMFAGVEYRTTERYNGKPVYTMRVNCGAGPNKTMIEISAPVENLETYIFCSVYGINKSMVMPVIGWSLETDYTNGGIVDDKIRIFSTTDVSAYNYCATIKYTKSTD